MKNNKKNIQLSYGVPITCSKDIKDFMSDMSKVCNIKQESGIVDLLVNDWTKNPKGKDHLVLYSNSIGEWFCNFLSDDEVIEKVELPTN